MYSERRLRRDGKGLLAGSTGVRSAEGRLGEPSEIARAALFLASDDSGLVIGIELSVDGGTAQI